MEPETDNIKVRQFSQWKLCPIKDYIIFGIALVVEEYYNLENDIWTKARQTKEKYFFPDLLFALHVPLVEVTYNVAALGCMHNI